MTLDDHVRDACHRIEELYYETGGKCYVSFSGGKDSTVLLALVKMCEEIYTIPEGAIPAVFSNTGIELGITVDFVKWEKENWYSNVQMIRPAHSFDWAVKHYGKPMLSKLRSHYLHQYCCGKRTDALMGILIDGISGTGKPTLKGRLAERDYHMLHDEFNIVPSEMCCNVLKKKPFEAYEKANGIKGAIIGLRASEGGVRETKVKQRMVHGGKLCTAVTRRGIAKYPIIDWSDTDLKEFIKAYNVPLSEAYTKYGFDRTGCMACPFAKRVDRDLEYLFYHEPNRYKASMHWLKDVYIAQNVVLPFDEAYEREREREWRLRYEPMRQEMLRKYRPESRRIKDTEQLSLFDEGEDE